MIKVSSPKRETGVSQGRKGGARAHTVKYSHLHTHTHTHTDSLFLYSVSLSLCALSHTLDPCTYRISPLVHYHLFQPLGKQSAPLRFKAKSLTPHNIPPA